jgi:hypothetical protein
VALLSICYAAFQTSHKNRGKLCLITNVRAKNNAGKVIQFFQDELKGSERSKVFILKSQLRKIFFETVDIMSVSSPIFAAS